MAKAKRAVNPPDKSGHRKGRAHVPARQEDMQPVSRRNPRICSTCGSRKAVDDRDRTEQVLAISDHPLVIHLRFHERSAENAGHIAESDRFLAWLDNSRTMRAARRDAAEQLAQAFAADYPVLGMMVSLSVFDERSDRDLARELGLDHRTIGKILDRGQELLKQLAAAREMYN